MKKSEYYKNDYPLEDLLPNLSKSEIETIVNECDYTNESWSKVNRTDAVVYYQMGYNAAKQHIEKTLKPVF